MFVTLILVPFFLKLNIPNLMIHVIGSNIEFLGSLSKNKLLKNSNAVSPIDFSAIMLYKIHNFFLSKIDLK